MKKQFDPSAAAQAVYCIFRFSILFAFFLIVANGAFAQGILVSGVVQDTKKNPLIGVTVSVRDEADADCVGAGVTSMT